MSATYAPSWNSLRSHATPQWFTDAKFGIYTHWGVYSVPAVGTPYSGDMYDGKSKFYKHHVEHYGDPREFGYKDLIPLFTAEHFDADEWADLFRRAGARFAGPVAEHHDGFAMWDSALTKWNAAAMGPNRDVVGELARAVRAQGMKLVTSFHHVTNWYWYPHWLEGHDVADPAYSGLYGPLHNVKNPPADWWADQDRPTEEFLALWQGKILEVIDKYLPDMLWFDFQLDHVPESYLQELFAYYFNKAESQSKEVLVTYKRLDLPPGIGIHDLERKLMPGRTNEVWLSDCALNLDGSWGYVPDLPYQSVDTLVDNLVDRVSKNGCLLLNVAPRSDGRIPEEAYDRLLGLGKWLELNGEALFDTVPWSIPGEGPTEPVPAGDYAREVETRFTGRDVRFTVKGDTLYAICLAWPGQSVTIQSLKRLFPEEIERIEMLGSEQPLQWSFDRKDGVTLQCPDRKPCDHAFVFKITRRHPGRIVR